MQIDYVTGFIAEACSKEFFFLFKNLKHFEIVHSTNYDHYFKVQITKIIKRKSIKRNHAFFF